MSKQLNNSISENEEYNKLIRFVINHFQWISIVFGILCYFVVFVIKKYNKEQSSWEYLVAEMLNVIGGAILSMGLVTIFYQKWKDKQDDKFKEMVKNFYEEFQNCEFKELKGQQKEVKDIVEDFRGKWEKQSKKKYFLMGPSFLGNGEELKEIANIDKETGKILLIGDVTKDKSPIKKEYGFITLLKDKNLKRGIPLFSYGTSFSFLDSTDPRGYYGPITEAIKGGLGLKVSILYPDKKLVDNPNIENVIDKSIATIEDFKDLITLNINSAPIELRLSREFSPCSFSSLEFDKGRTIRSLEFNFMHEGKEGEKMTQIYENYDNNNIHSTFSQYLYNRYERLYQESFLALRFPMDEITYYVMGILVDDMPEKSNTQIKETIVDATKQLIKIVICLDGDILKVKVGDTKKFYSEEKIWEKYEGLENTIIGNVLCRYKEETGCSILPFKSFEIKNPKENRTSNEFILLGRIQSTENPESLPRVDVTDENSQIYSQLRCLIKRAPDADIERKIKKIIKIL